MPFDLRFNVALPGYAYCGRGRSSQSTPPVNALDLRCREHDYLYAMAVCDADRARADRALRSDAWKIGGVAGCAVAGAMVVKLGAAKVWVQL